MSLYSEVIKTGILFRRPFRLIENLCYMFINKTKTGKPFQLKFESSTLCNLRCKMCPLNKGLSRDTGILSFENFKKIYDEIKPPYLNLTGIGEPLLNKDLFKIIVYARKKGSIVKLDTNATLLDEENIKKLIEANPSFISVSIDGITKKTYEVIRVGAKFEKVVNNLRNLVKYRNRLKSKTKIHLFFVLQKNNIIDLIEFIKFGNDLNVDSINGTIVIPLGKNKNENNLKIKEKDKLKLKRELKELRKKLKVSLNIETIDSFLNNNINKKEKPCFFPWYQTYITWDGYVVPCCMFCDNEIIFGNVFEEPFMKIWNNEKAREFRKQLLIERKGICYECGVDESFISDRFKPFYKIPFMKLIIKGVFK